jgi:hypothetical protein
MASLAFFGNVHGLIHVADALDTRSVVGEDGEFDPRLVHDFQAMVIHIQKLGLEFIPFTGIPGEGLGFL